jgi:hypothetical protein
MRRTLAHRALALAATLAAAALPACQKTPEPAPTGAPAPPPAGSAAAATSAAATGPRDVAWDTPAGWQKVENPNTMRKATFKIPKAEGDAEDAELSVSQAGGTVAMNIDRWTRQFEKAPGDETKREDRKVGELSVTVVEIHGTWSGSGMPGAPQPTAKPKWAMLGAIVDTKPEPHFFKLTGPEKTVVAARADFDKLIASLRPK